MCLPAPLTTIVSFAFGAHSSISPKYAESPVIPKTPKRADMGVFGIDSMIYGGI